MRKYPPFWAALKPRPSVLVAAHIGL